MSKKSDYTIKVNFPFADMAAFQRYVVGLRYENRFSLKDEAELFVVQLLKYATKFKVKKFKSGRNFYRARINDINSKDSYSLADMGSPPKELAGHGRLNPKGIPYLYLSSNQLTAVSEIRPWVGSNVTVAQFELIKDIQLINFSNKYFKNKPKDEQFSGAEFTWEELISWMFTHPFDPRDDTAYVPTQYLSERIKGEGYDGILYDSSLNPNGYNVTLFDSSFVTGTNRSMATVNSIKIKPSYKKL